MQSSRMWVIKYLKLYWSTAHLYDKRANAKVPSSDYQSSLMTLINRNVHWSLINDMEGGSYQRNLTADTSV